MLEMKDDYPLLQNNTQHVRIGEMEDCCKVIYTLCEYENAIAVPRRGSALMSVFQIAQ